MAARTVTSKTQPTSVSPTAFVARIENDVRRRDAERLLAHFSVLTGAEAKMWGPSIVGFGSYHYRYESGHEGDSFLAGFAPRKNETVIYLSGQVSDQADLLARLGRHRMGKSCLYIKNLDAIDFAVLTELVEKSVADLKARYPA